MTLLQRFLGLDDEPVVSQERYASARTFLSWSEDEHFKKLLEWLDEEACKPLPLTDAGMVQGAVRANTLREVADHLRRDVRHARNDARAYENEVMNG